MADGLFYMEKVEVQILLGVLAIYVEYPYFPYMKYLSLYRSSESELLLSSLTEDCKEDVG